MKKNFTWALVVVILSLILVFTLVFNPSSAPPVPTPTETVLVPTNTESPTLTPDPCSPENLSTYTTRVHLLTREFDDTSVLAQTTLLQDVVPLVQDLQRIRRNSEDLEIPSCLDDLKEFQLAHMNTMIDVFTTALSFYNAFGPGGDQKALDQVTMPMLEQARWYLEQYVIEYSRLLGNTPFPTPTLIGSGTLTPPPSSTD
jgi:hypothetical protein